MSSFAIRATPSFLGRLLRDPAKNVVWTLRLCLLSSGVFVLVLTHWIFVIALLVAPVAALTIASRKAIRGRNAMLRGLTVTVVLASACGSGLSVAYGFHAGGRVPVGEVLASVYVAAGVLVLLHGFDWLVATLAKCALGSKRRSSAIATGVIRTVALLVVGLPFVLSTMLIYRPRAIAESDPLARYGLEFSPVEFASTDGEQIVGWWIPADQPNDSSRRGRRGARRDADFGEKTVIVCPGSGSTKLDQLLMAQRLLGAGYNILIFDFRATGSSAGILSTAGKLEARDVAGALRWLRSQRARQSKRIVGVGADTGAAALLAAVAEERSSGAAASFDAIVVFNGFDRLDRVIADQTDAHVLPPFGFFIKHLILPLASAQSGANLCDIAPARDIANVWPTPVLVIHGMRDAVVPAARGQSLFDAASFPREHFWAASLSGAQAIADEQIAERVREFVESARGRQVI